MENKLAAFVEIEVVGDVQIRREFATMEDYGKYLEIMGSPTRPPKELGED